MCASEIEANDVLLNGLQLLVQNDEEVTAGENLIFETESGKLRNEHQDSEETLSSAVPIQEPLASQGTDKSFENCIPEVKMQSEEENHGNYGQSQAEERNDSTKELEFEKDCGEFEDILIVRKQMNSQEDSTLTCDDASWNDEQPDFEGLETVGEPLRMDIALQRDDDEQEVGSKHLTNDGTKGETTNSTGLEVIDVEIKSEKALASIEKTNEMDTSNSNYARKESTPTQLGGVTQDELHKTDENIQRQVLADLQYNILAENNCELETSDCDLHNKNQNTDENLTAKPLKIENVDNQGSFENLTIPSDFMGTNLVPIEETTIEVKISRKKNDELVETEYFISTKDDTGIISEALGSEAAQFSKMMDNFASDPNKRNGKLRMTLLNSFTSSGELQPENIVDSERKNSSNNGLFLERNVDANDLKPAVDLNEEFLLLTSTLIKDIAKETHYYTVNEKILNSNMSRTSLWNSKSEQSSLKRRSNSMGNCRQELILSPNRLAALDPLRSETKQTRRTSSSLSHDADATSVSSYRYYRSRQNSSFRRDGPCTVLFQDLGVVNADEETREAPSSEEFVRKRTRNLDAMSHFWLMHSILSINGMIVFSLKSFEDFDYKKFAFTAVHGVVIIFATVYTMTFYARGDLPAWFIIYTLPFLGMHFYALGLQIHSIKERNNFKSFLLAFKRLEFESSKYYTMGPVISLVYSLLNLGLLFVVMPAEAYGITVALLPSIFNPGMYDMYMIMIARALANSYKLVEEDARRTKHWTAKHSRIFERKLKELYHTIQRFNRTFSKNLLSRRTLFLFQLLANSYVITAIINFEDMCLLLFVCTLVTCMEILIRLYVLCSHGDRLLDQYKSVQHQLLKIYYSLDGNETINAGRRDSRSVERRSRVKQTHEKRTCPIRRVLRAELVTPNTRMATEATSDAGNLPNSAIPNNIIEKETNATGGHSVEKSLVPQEETTCANDVDCQSCNKECRKGLTNKNTKECTSSDNNTVSKLKISEVENQKNLDDLSPYPVTSEVSHGHLEIRAKRPFGTTLTNFHKTPIAYNETNVQILNTQKTMNESLNGNNNEDTKYNIHELVNATKTESFNSKHIEDSKCHETPEPQTTNSKDTVLSTKLKGAETSIMEQGLLTTWQDLRSVELTEGDMPLHSIFQESHTTFGQEFVEADKFDDTSKSSDIDIIKADATEHHRADSAPELEYTESAFENESRDEVSQAKMTNFVIPQIIISDVDCDPSPEENNSPGITLASTKAMQNPSNFPMHHSVLQPPPIFCFNDQTGHMTSSTDLSHSSKLIVNAKCPLSMRNSQNLLSNQSHRNVSNIENRLPKDNETLLQSWKETNIEKIQIFNPDETCLTEGPKDIIAANRHDHIDDRHDQWNSNDADKDTESIFSVKSVAQAQEGDTAPPALASRKFLHPDEAAQRKIYGSVCEFNISERKKQRDSSKRRQRRKRKINGKQRLAMLLGRLEFRNAEMQISGEGRLGSDSLVSLLSITVTFIAVLLQILPDRPLGSSAIHGSYDACFYYKD